MRDKSNPSLYELLHEGDANKIEAYVKRIGMETFIEEYRTIIQENDLSLPIHMANAGHAQVRNGIIWSDTLFGLHSYKSCIPYLFNQGGVRSGVVFTSKEQAEGFIQTIEDPDVEIIALVNGDAKSVEAEVTIDRKSWMHKYYEYGIDYVSVNPKFEKVSIFIDFFQLMKIGQGIFPGIKKEAIEPTRHTLFYLYFLAQEVGRINQEEMIQIHKKEVQSMYLMLACDRGGRPIIFRTRSGETAYYTFSNIDEIARIVNESSKNIYNIVPVKVTEILKAARMEKVRILLNPFGPKMHFSERLQDILLD